MANFRPSTLGIDPSLSPATPSTLGLDQTGIPGQPHQFDGPTRGTLGINGPGNPARNLLLASVPTAGGRLPAESTFKTAIELFRASPQSKTADGKRILQTLDDAYKSSKLSYADMGPAGDSDPQKGTIRITKVYENDPMKTSIWLVHEAYHVAVVKDDLLYVDEEINSREIQGEYWDYLIAKGIRLADGQLYQLKDDDSALPKAYRKDQIIDWVIPMYWKKEADFTIPADWIVKNKDNWGKLCNRTLNTRKIYAKILVDSQPTFALNPRPIDPKVAGALFELLECNPLESGVIIREVGEDGEDEVRTILGKLPPTMKTRYEEWKKKTGR